MAQTIYSISAAPLFPDGKTGFTRTIGEGFTLSAALEDATVWADDFDPAEHAETCEVCGGEESEGCDNEHCEGGKESPDGLDLTASWSEYEGDRLATWRKDRRLLLVNRISNIGFDELADELREADAAAALEIVKHAENVVGSEHEVRVLLPMLQELNEIIRATA